jgi:hypothetical protein
MINNYKQIKQTAKDWKESQMVDGKLSQLEEGHRKDDILIFGSEERKDEGYFDTSGDVMKILREFMKLDVLNGSINYVARLRRRRGQRQILAKFTSFSEN